VVRKAKRGGCYFDDSTMFLNVAVSLMAISDSILRLRSIFLSFKALINLE